MTITATKPADSIDGPRWATTDPGTQRVEPIEGLKDTGWTSGQRPSFGEMNWLQGAYYDWQQYFEDATDQVDASKINKTGAADLSGTFSPTANNGASIGDSGHRFHHAFVGDVDAASDVKTAGDLVTATDASKDIGKIAATWLNAWVQTAHVAAIRTLGGTTSDIGSSSHKFRALYVGDVNADGLYADLFEPASGVYVNKAYTRANVIRARCCVYRSGGVWLFATSYGVASVAVITSGAFSGCLRFTLEDSFTVLPAAPNFALMEVSAVLNQYVGVGGAPYHFEVASADATGFYLQAHDGSAWVSFNAGGATWDDMLLMIRVSGE